jgi:ubiquinone biosynthesis protein
MGITLSPLRTVIAALIALFSASPIITAMAGATVSRKHPGMLPALWFVFLGVVIAMLVGMIFLVISEALAPSGSLPGPLYALRGARRIARRARRYSQIIRILARHGLIPHLRGVCRARIRRAALTCWPTLGTRDHPPRLLVHGPGIRLAGAPGTR